MLSLRSPSAELGVAPGNKRMNSTMSLCHYLFSYVVSKEERKSIYSICVCVCMCMVWGCENSQ